MRFAGATARSAGFRAKTDTEATAPPADLVREAVRLAQQGNREAIRFLYARYADNVYGYVRSIVRADDEAEDVTQQVFVKLMTSIGKYNERGVPFFAWLLRLAHNAAIDHLRKKRAKAADGTIEEFERSHEPENAQLQNIRAALATLPSAQREVVVLMDLVGLSSREIATHMQRSESSVHGLHHRARRVLQRELTRRGCTPVTQSRGQLAAAA